MKHVVPSPNLKTGEYVKGIGKAGAELPDKEAEALIKAGLVVEKSGNVRPRLAGDDVADVDAGNAKGSSK